MKRGRWSDDGGGSGLLVPNDLRNRLVVLSAVIGLVQKHKPVCMCHLSDVMLR